MNQEKTFALPERLRVSQRIHWERFDDNANERFCEEFAAAGAEYLAVNTESVLRMSQDSAFLPQLATLVGRHGLRFRDAHAPWGEGWDLNELPENCPNLAVHEEILRRLGGAGVKTYTIHPGGMVCYRRQWFGNQERIRSVAAHALERLLKTAEAAGVVIAVENVFDPASIAQEALALVHRFPSPNLGICLDCGHANLLEPCATRAVEKMVGYILDAWKPGIPVFSPGIAELLCDEIVTVHLHDNDGLCDLHAALGTGIIDWRRYSGIFARAPRLISLQSEVDPSPNVSPAEIFRNFALLRYDE